MKKSVVVLAAMFLTALVFTMVAGASPAPKATGDVTFTRAANGNLNYATFTAQVGPNGVMGNVHVLVTTSGGAFVQEFWGTVDCYSQDPTNSNEAWFSGTVTQLDLGSNTNTNMVFRFHVIDNGQGFAADPDQIGFDRSIFGGDQGQCHGGTGAALTAMFPVTGGNLQVFAAPTD